MKTVEVKTRELEGAALDWAVAKIAGVDVGVFFRGNAYGADEV